VTVPVSGWPAELSRCGTCCQLTSPVDVQV
jgi:hypothetical protein